MKNALSLFRHASVGASAGEPDQAVKKSMKFALSLGGTLPWERVQENLFRYGRS